MGAERWDMAVDSPQAKVEPRNLAGVGRFPRHIAIIMDGNGRWAERRGLPRAEGHRRGVVAVRRTVEAAIALDVRYLTIYSFSAENWSRPAAEVDEIMGLLKRFIRNDLADLHRNNVKVLILGERDTLAADLRLLLDEAEHVTQGNTGLTLCVAFNYGGRQEIALAARRIGEAVARGELDPSTIDANALNAHLGTAGLPDPDLLIRTSGEQRLSNFLLWQAAYAEFVFLPVLWPDFDRHAFEEALGIYAARGRRFGGVVGSP